jgi:hypothetical protein
MEPTYAATAAPGARELSHTILWDEFSSTNRQTPGRMSEVAVLEVPAGQILSLKPLMFAAILKAEHIERFTAAAGATVAIDLGAAGHRPILTAQTAPAFPTTNHPDLSAWISSDNGVTWTESNVTAYNPATRTITVAKLAGTNAVAVYFVPGDGEIAFYAKRPTGSDDVKAVLYRTTARALFQSDQSNERSAPRFSDFKRLPPFWKLSIEMSTVSSVKWTPRAEHILELPSTKLTVKVNDRQMLDQSAERILRGGLQ